MQQFCGKNRTINFVDLGIIDYQEALAMQEKLLILRKNNYIGDILLLLEHNPVITIGKIGNQGNILASRDFLQKQGVNICHTGRGGDVTYHGLGQIVGYPIIRFQNYVAGVRELVHSLEEVFIQLLKNDFHIFAKRDPQHPGVWVENDKITALGLSIRSGITMHGFAFNVNTDLRAFLWILSCGISGKGVTSLKKLIGREQDLQYLKKLIVKYFSEIFKTKVNWQDRKELKKILVNYHE